MADIRELTTKFTFKVDESGIKQYEAVVTRIKGLAIEAGKMFGLYFAVDKISEYVSELVKAGKEMNRINTQIAQLQRRGDDAVAAQESLFNIAQKLGVEYTHVADVYRDFLNDSQESKISQDELLNSTDNLFKSMRVGRASSEQMAEALAAMNRGLRMGQFGARSLGVLLDTPGLASFLRNVKGGEEGLRQLAKSGKLTGEIMLKYLSQPSQELNDAFDRMPKTLGMATMAIFNDLSKLISQVWKLSRGFSALGTAIWWMYSRARNALTGLIDVLGGLKNALEFVGIAMALVIGPYMLRQAALMTGAFIRMAIASWSIWLPWAAIGAAILFAAGMIQDVMIWMRNPNSKTIMGDLLGPFDEFKKQFTEMPIFKFAEGFAKLFTDPKKGIEEMIAALKEANGALQIMSVLAFSVFSTFLLWKSLQWLVFRPFARGLLGLGKAAKEVAEVLPAAVGGGGKGKAGGTPGVAKPGGGRIAKGAGIAGLGLSIASALGVFGEGRGADAASGAGLGLTIGSMLGPLGAGIGGLLGGAIGFGAKDILHPTPVGKDETPWGTFGWMKKKGWFDIFSPSKTSMPWFNGGAGPGEQPPREPGSGRGDATKGAFPGTLGMTDMATLMQGLTYGTMPWDAGAFAKTPAPANVNTTLNQSNSITVTLQPDEAMLANMIQQKVTEAGNTIIDRASRQMSDAIPRMEKAVQ